MRLSGVLLNLRRRCGWAAAFCWAAGLLLLETWPVAGWLADSLTGSREQLSFHTLDYPLGRRPKHPVHNLPQRPNLPVAISLPIDSIYIQPLLLHTALAPCSVDTWIPRCNVCRMIIWSRTSTATSNLEIPPAEISGIEDRRLPLLVTTRPCRFCLARKRALAALVVVLETSTRGHKIMLRLAASPALRNPTEYLQPVIPQCAHRRQ